MNFGYKNPSLVSYMQGHYYFKYCQTNKDQHALSSLQSIEYVSIGRPIKINIIILYDINFAVHMIAPDRSTKWVH